MRSELIQSHYGTAQELLSRGELGAALRKAEQAVDVLWKEGDPQIAKALPLLSMLHYSNKSDGDLFETLDDLPISFSDSLMFESLSLHEQHQSDASSKMLADVNRFMKRWGCEVQPVEVQPVWKEQSEFTPVVDEKATVPVVDEKATVPVVDEKATVPVVDQKVTVPVVDQRVTTSIADEKVAELRQQITQFYADGERDLAVEASLELANEYALRGKNKQALKLFTQVAIKSKRPGRTLVRINCLLDFGQFMSRNAKPVDAERLLRIAAGVARNAREKEKFAHVIAALGVVLMHQSKNDSAKKHLEKAKSMLDVWDVEADIVNQHLEALKENVSCDCPEATPDFSFADADWD